jgi:hypothetical protein
VLRGFYIDPRKYEIQVVNYNRWGGEGKAGKEWKYFNE